LIFREGACLVVTSAAECRASVETLGEFIMGANALECWDSECIRRTMSLIVRPMVVSVRSQR
jgi:hypothetical protein